MFKTMGFIGGGRIVRIMLEGWQRSGSLLPEIVVYDQSEETVAALKEAFPQVRSGSLAEACSQDLVFGALHPPVLREALPEIGQHLQADAVFCSLAPVIRLAGLQQMLGGFTRLARFIPSASSIIGAGFNPVSFDEALPQDAHSALQAVLAPLGSCPEVDDKMLETYAVLTAMGPTYFWFQFEELRQMALSWGMDAETANQALAGMLHGAVDTLFAGDLPADRVMDLIPVRPMAEDENAIREMMQTRLGTIYSKLNA